MRGEKREQLVVNRGEGVLLLQKTIDRDQSDDVILDLERNSGEWPLDCHQVVGIVAVAEVTLAGFRNFAEQSVAEGYGDVLDARHDVFAFGGDGFHLTGSLVHQKNGERLRSDEIDDDLLDDLNDFAEVERGVKLIAGDVEVGEVVVLLLDL